MSPSGSDHGNCTAAQPCATLDRAYHVAAPGQVVQLASGNYGSQTINADSTKTGSARVVFRPAAGATPTFDLIDILGSHIEIDGVHTSVWRTEPSAADILLRGVTTKVFFITSSHNITVLGGSVGPNLNQASEIRNCTNCTSISNNIKIDGVLFHDYVKTIPGIHMECLHAYPVRNFTLLNSRFENCAIMDLFFANYGDAGDLANLDIENNYFDAPGSHGGPLSAGYYAVVFGYGTRSLSNVRLAYNSMLSSPILDGTTGSVNNITFLANVAPFNPWLCQKGVTYIRNVWTATTCSPTDVKAPLGFVNPSRMDLRLLPGAAAIGHGDRSSFPRTDISGALRSPLAPDAGAAQREPATVLPGHSIGDARLGMSRGAIEAIYGSATHFRIEKIGHARVVVRSYRRGDARVSVAYSRSGRAVALWTSTPYYTTVRGVSVGLRATKARALVPGLRQSTGCDALQRRVGSTALQLSVHAGAVTRIGMFTAPLAAGCPTQT